MQVLDAPIARLRAAPRNANRMDERKFRLLVDSIQRVGFVDPVVLHDLGDGHFEIVDGHHRVRAMTELGFSEIPALVIKPGEDPRLVSLALNRIRGETDLAVAALIIEELTDDGLTPADLAISGFTEAELASLAAALDPPEPSLGDLADAEVPDEVGSPAARPFLLELTFRSREDLALVRKALRKAAGKGNDPADGLLRLVQG